MNNINPLDKDIFWDAFLKTIEDSVNVQSFNTWFKPIKLEDVNDHSLVISVPKAYFSSWLEEHYMPLLMSTSKSILGHDISISFVNLEETIYEVIHAFHDSRNPATGDDTSFHVLREQSGPVRDRRRRWNRFRQRLRLRLGQRLGFG